MSCEAERAAGRPCAVPEVPLIPREALLAHPVRSDPRLSPDSQRLAYLAPFESGTLGLWIRNLDLADDRPLTPGTGSGIYGYSWAPDGRCLLYFQDHQGDEVQHLYSVDAESLETRDLTPFPGVRAQNLLTDADHPGEVLVGLNLRNPRVFDMYRISLATGEVVPDTENPGDVLSWTTDGDFRIRACSAMSAEDASTAVRVRETTDAPWREIYHVPFERSVQPAQMNGGNLVVGFSGDGRALYLVSALHSPTARLVKVDARSGRELAVVAEDPRCDVDADVGPDDMVQYTVLRAPQTGEPQAVGFDYAKREWIVLDPALDGDFAALRTLGRGVFKIISRDRAGARWVVQVVNPAGPQEFYLYDCATRKARLLFVDQPQRAAYPLAEVEPVTITARDGLQLPGYLTLPVSAQRADLPMVLCPHGGPWWRDRWEFDVLLQLLANRGYAVLQVNFRGSSGFGTRFLNAGNGEWGVGKMQDDLTDAVRWAVATGIADPARVGILGASYGGYATLCGITFTPELYACAVDLVGPSQVGTLLSSMPDYWGPIKKRWVRRIGDLESDPSMNERISPLFHADRIRAPLLIAHGANDPRATLGESERIAAAIRERGGAVTLVVYPDEGHRFSRPENNIDFFGRMEEFLAAHLGGRCEPWRPVPGSSATR